MTWLRQYTQSVLGQLNPNRLLALDVFRGITITAMILVNNPGSWSYVYRPLGHADWHGWTPTDLIFPFFIFIVGVAISLSIGVMFKKGISNITIVKGSGIRMVKLILLGWFLALFFFSFVVENYNWLEQKLYALRVMGVLQRIGIVYFICVVAYLYLPKRIFYWSAPALLVIYALMIYLISYSDQSGQVYVGLLEKGNNLAAWLDNLVLTTQHVYAKSAQPFAYDPEGILSTIPAIATCISGIAVGEYLAKAKQQDVPLLNQIKLMTLVGGVATIAGLLLDTLMPINKTLWTPSYVLLSSGLALLCFAACMYLIDHKHCKAWSAPFIVFGANSIAFFMFAGVVGRLVVMFPVGDINFKAYLFAQFYQPLFGNYNGSLAYAISFLFMSYFVFHYMYKKNIIWKV